MSRFPLCLLAAALLAPLAGHAQSKEGKDSPPRMLRVWPLGDTPPFRQEVRGGVRYELEPPPGSIPPRRVTIGLGEPSAAAAAADDDDDPRPPAELRLMLGRLSEAVPVPAGAGPLLLRNAEAPGDSAPWLRAARPESGGFLLLIWRAPEAQTWDTPRFLTLPDTPAVAPAGGLTIISVAPQPIALVLGEEKLALPAGRPVRRRLEPGQPLPVQAAVATADGGLQRFVSQVLEQGPGERTWLVFHRADGVAPRQPVKMAIHREPFAPLQPPAAPAAKPR